MSDRLVLQPVRLPLKRFAFEIANGLPDFRDDRAILSSMKAHRLDVRTDQAHWRVQYARTASRPWTWPPSMPLAQVTSSASAVSTLSMSRALKRS